MDDEPLDISPLLVINKVHEARYATIRLLKGLFENIPAVLACQPRDVQFNARIYTQRLVIQLLYEYLEDVASYSVAGLETGLLYAQRVVSVTPEEIGRF